MFQNIDLIYFFYNSGFCLNIILKNFESEKDHPVLSTAIKEDKTDQFYDTDFTNRLGLDINMGQEGYSIQKGPEMKSSAVHHFDDEFGSQEIFYKNF